MEKIPLFHKVIASGFGAGCSPVAPGTAGTLVATLLWTAVALITDDSFIIMSINVGCAAVSSVLGVWSSGIAERFWGKDSKRIVIDEMAGAWIALLAVPSPHGWGYVVAAFLLFRFFDIAKPLGIRKAECLPGGFGVMADDILAGLYSMAVIFIYRWVCA